ncbi:MAG: hypothetical protein ACLPN1_18940 [Dissulfurispiraceae bacterium]
MGTKHGKHLSQRFNDAYNWYQGWEPESARFVFIGRDANYLAELDEKSSIFKEIEYYWEME